MADTEKQSDEPQLPFEEALEELQAVVAALEEGTLGLEESMEQFERGLALLRSCYRTLEAAEQRIMVLTGIDEDGNPQLEAFDASATAENGGRSTGRRRATKQSRRTGDPDEDETLF